MSIQELIFDTADAQPYAQNPVGERTGELLTLLNLKGEEVQVDRGQVRALSAEETQVAWQQLSNNAAWQAQLVQELPGLPPGLPDLLQARTPEAFLAALSDLTGVTDAAGLEAQLAALERHAAEAQRRLAAGQTPSLNGLESVSGRSPAQTPALLALLALGRGAREPVEPLAPAAPIQVKLPPPKLDFSLENLLGRKLDSGKPDSGEP